jgi:hypothetical protein
MSNCPNTHNSFGKEGVGPTPLALSIVYKSANKEMGNQWTVRLPQTFPPVARLKGAGSLDLDIFSPVSIFRRWWLFQLPSISTYTHLILGGPDSSNGFINSSKRAM